MSRARADRLSFAKIPEVLPLPDLLSVQHDSFGWFLESGLQYIFSEVSPIEDFTGNLALELTEHRFGDPPLHIEEAKEQDANYSKPLFVTARFLNRETGEIKEQQVFLGDFPMMTANGTFIINGTERVVVSQLVRSPGVYFDKSIDKTSDKDVFAAKVIPGRGAWLEFDIDKKDTVGVRVDRKRRQYVTTFLRASVSPRPTRRSSSSSTGRGHPQLAGEGPDQHRDEALLDLYRKLRPGELTTVESARGLINTLFYNPKRYDLTRVGRYKLDQKFGREPVGLEDYIADEHGLLSHEDMLETIKYLVHLHSRHDGYRTDDIDNFANRRIRTVGELIQNQIRVGLSRLERVVRERMTTQDPEAITPQSLINIRPVVASIKEFFGTSQLSQFMDQPNPLASLTHRRRLSALGPGRPRRGAGRVRGARRAPVPLRPDVPDRDAGGSEHRAHRFAGQLRQGQPVRLHRDAVPPGDQGQGDQAGRLPHRSQEETHVIAQANALLNDDGSFVNDRVWSARRAARSTRCRLEVDYMDVSPKQVVSVSTSLIPFLEHDDANRALMGSNMQRQAVPLLRADAPLVGTGVEGRAAHDSGDVILSPVDGEVVDVTGEQIVVKEAGANKKHTFALASSSAPTRAPASTRSRSVSRATR